jgi:Icc-related predicted phosphoesterase
MKFIAISDLHGKLPVIHEEFDLLIIAGDLCPHAKGVKLLQMNWFGNTFINWVKVLPFKHSWSKVIYVPGNHDECFDEYITNIKISEYEFETNNRLKILVHDVYNFEYPVSDGVDSLKIFGTPYCKQFGNWAFMVDNETLDKKYSQIPEDTDILISHDSPQINNLGKILDENFYHYGVDAGNPVLTKHLLRIKPLIFHSGHIHSGNHEFTQQEGIWLSNVSYLGEDYIPKYEILTYNFNEEIKNVEL